MSRGTVPRLALAFENDEKLNQKFHDCQFAFMLRELQKGMHIDYEMDEIVPLELVHSLPPAATLQKWSRIHLPTQPNEVFIPKTRPFESEWKCGADQQGECACRCQSFFKPGPCSYRANLGVVYRERRRLPDLPLRRRTYASCSHRTSDCSAVPEAIATLKQRVVARVGGFASPTPWRIVMNTALMMALSDPRTYLSTPTTISLSVTAAPYGLCRRTRSIIRSKFTTTGLRNATAIGEPCPLIQPLTHPAHGSAGDLWTAKMPLPPRL